jgi:hypothetical protein
MLTTKKSKTSKTTGRAALGSASGELPLYSADIYRESIISVKRKLGRLERFSLAELERLQENNAGHPIDWNLERRKMTKTLDRWLRQTNDVISELMKLLLDIRDDQAILEEFTRERSRRLIS